MIMSYTTEAGCDLYKQAQLVNWLPLNSLNHDNQWDSHLLFLRISFFQTLLLLHAYLVLFIGSRDLLVVTGLYNSLNSPYNLLNKCLSFLLRNPLVYVMYMTRHNRQVCKLQTQVPSHMFYLFLLIFLTRNAAYLEIASDGLEDQSHSLINILPCYFQSSCMRLCISPVQTSFFFFPLRLLPCINIWHASIGMFKLHNQLLLLSFLSLFRQELTTILYCRTADYQALFRFGDHRSNRLHCSTQITNQLTFSFVIPAMSVQ